MNRQRNESSDNTPIQTDDSFNSSKQQLKMSNKQSDEKVNNNLKAFFLKENMNYALTLQQDEKDQICLEEYDFGQDFSNKIIKSKKEFEQQSENSANQNKLQNLRQEIWKQSNISQQSNRQSNSNLGFNQKINNFKNQIDILDYMDIFQMNNWEETEEHQKQNDNHNTIHQNQINIQTNFNNQQNNVGNTITKKENYKNLFKQEKKDEKNKTIEQSFDSMNYKSNKKIEQKIFRDRMKQKKQIILRNKDQQYKIYNNQSQMYDTKSYDIMSLSRQSDDDQEQIKNKYIIENKQSPICQKKNKRIIRSVTAKSDSQNMSRLCDSINKKEPKYDQIEFESEIGRILQILVCNSKSNSQMKKEIPIFMKGYVTRQQQKYHKIKSKPIIYPRISVQEKKKFSILFNKNKSDIPVNEKSKDYEQIDGRIVQLQPLINDYSEILQQINQSEIVDYWKVIQNEL